MSRDRDLDIVDKLAVDHAWVHGDAIKLHQSIANLGRNAVEALPDRTGHVELALSTLPESAPRSLQLVIEDNGCGIAAGYRAIVSEPYFTTKPGHSGLGLSVSRHIIESLGGRIELGHAAAGGTRVTLELPLATTKA